MGRGTGANQAIAINTLSTRGQNSPSLTEVEQATLDTYEASANAWSETRSDQNFWAAELNQFSQLLPAGRVIDIGSGNGRDAVHLTNSGYQVTGIDISPALLDLAKETCPEADFQEASVYDLPFNDQSFDGVWAVASLLHLPKDRLAQALNELWRVLRDDGLAFISVKKGHGEELKDEDLGQRFFSYYQPDELRTALTASGLEVEKFEEREAGGANWLSAWSRAS